MTVAVSPVDLAYWNHLIQDTVREPNRTLAKRSGQ
jgi:hypothetical protein